MKITFPTASGNPEPLGTTQTTAGINFALFSRHATAVALVLAPRHGQPEEQVVIALDPHTNKTGDIWHIMVAELPGNTLYGYRISGPWEPHTTGHAFNSALILLDPHAREISSPAWARPRPDLGSQPCCTLPDASYDWQGDRPLQTPLSDTIIYELHVRGFTIHPSAACRQPGTFQGITEKIDYLRQLGITAVELMPVTEFDENDCPFHNPETGEQLKNFWGYNPLSFFAPKAAYAGNHTEPLHAFRDMVKALHRAGIEVILDIVYNHTAEGDWNGTTTSFRGIDNTIYYLLDPWTKAYLNFSGCGNTCNCNHPVMRSLIMAALRWWVIEMHVDGFRFDLASILGRDQTGNVLANPPVVEMIAEDPVLSKTKIIAEAWDAAGLYQVGNFSPHHRWAEWNGRFRDDIRSFMCGKPGMVPALATRIAGSSDLYQPNGRSPSNSINFITSHDGFTLADLVSYERKHNQANGEKNIDGENNNLSWHSGIEGPTDDPAVLRLRRRRLKTMAVILFLSQGVPMLVAGDEFGRSQQGNNNAWCQDNEISWINWQLARQNSGQLRFFQRLIQLRKNHPVFRRKKFFPVNNRPDAHPGKEEISWQGLHPGEQDWSHHCHTLAFTLHGGRGTGQFDDDFFIMLNGHTANEASFTIPAPGRDDHQDNWLLRIDTSQSSPNDITRPEQAAPIAPFSTIAVAAMGCIVLQAKRKKQ